MCLVEPQADGIERVDIDPFRQPGFIAQQPPQLDLQRICQGVGEGRQQDASVGLRAPRCKATMVLPVPAEPETRAGQVVGQGQQGVLGCRLGVVEPLGGHAVAE